MSASLLHAEFDAVQASRIHT